jgi:hypothetical protein
MNDLKRFLILVFSLPLLVSFDWYDYICEKIERTYVMTSLSFHGFKCSTKTLSDCSYSQCEGTIGDYPKPVFITVPQEIDSLGLHFHGHLLGTTTSKPYDGPPAEMIKNFGVENSLCKSKQLTVIPTSTGANADYLGYFKDSPNYTQFMENIQKTLGGSLRNAPLHLSGHSGGGKYVEGSLDA